MSVKLYKTEKENYILIDPTKGTYDDGYVLGTSRESQYNKLSLKNCQAIERGYDLNELAEKHINHEPHTTYILQRKFDFIDGFRKALGILGDKKFSEKELTMLFAYGHQIGMNDVLAIQSQHSPQPMPRPDSDKLRDELIQSLQKNEWEVEVEMECTQCQSYGYVSECRDNCNKKFLQPKLDADGCLILKRV